MTKISALNSNANFFKKKIERSIAESSINISFQGEAGYIFGYLSNEVKTHIHNIIKQLQQRRK